MSDYFAGEGIQLKMPSPSAENLQVKSLFPPPVSVDPDAIPSEIKDALSKGKVMDYDAWKKVDEEEQRRGKEKGKEKERMDWEGAREFLADSAMA